MPISSVVMIPIVANIRAGYDGEAIEEFQGFEPAYDIKSPDGCVWMHVRGNSMFPKLEDGDLVLVRKQSDVECGEIGVVIYNGEDATVKKIQKQENAISLVPINSEYPTKVIVGKDLEQVMIYGKVIESKRKF